LIRFDGGFFNGRSAAGVSRSSNTNELRSDEDVLGFVDVREPSVGRFTAVGSGEASAECDVWISYPSMFGIWR